MSRESQHTRFEDQILGQVSLWGRPASCASLYIIYMICMLQLDPHLPCCPFAPIHRRWEIDGNLAFSAPTQKKNRSVSIKLKIFKFWKYFAVISNSKSWICCRLSIYIICNCWRRNNRLWYYLVVFRQRSKCQDQRAIEMMNNRSFVLPQLDTLERVGFD